MKSLDELAGVGLKTIKLFNKLGIYDVFDLVYFYPKRYEVLKRTDMQHVIDNSKVVFDGIVEGHPTVRQISPKLKRGLFRVSNSCNIYNICVFNQEYLCKNLRIGMSVIIIGKYDQRRNLIVASEVRFGKLPVVPQIEPIYSTTEGLNKKLISRVIENLLKEQIDLIDYIPDYLIGRYHFPNKLWAVDQIHHPTDALSFQKAKQRLKYEEFFWYLLRINYFKFTLKDDKKAIKRCFDEKKLYSFIEGLSFVLTPDQKKVVEEIKFDLFSNKRMNRLLQGDVGSGKTIVAFLASYINFLSGYQTALMVPTEILANQHFYNAISLFQDVGMRIGLLTSSISKKKKINFYNKFLMGH